MAFQLEVTGGFSPPRRRLAALLCAMPLFVWMAFLLFSFFMLDHASSDQAEGYGWFMVFGIGFSLFNLPVLLASGFWLANRVNTARKTMVVLIAANVLCMFIPGLLVAAFFLPALLMKPDLAHVIQEKSPGQSAPGRSRLN